MNITSDDTGWLQDVWPVFKKLDLLYPRTELGNRQDPMDELIYILLSTRTREEYYQAAFNRVGELVGWNWNGLLHASRSSLVTAIGSAGLASKKATVLQAIAKELDRLHGEVDLVGLAELSTDEAEEMLLALPGVGVKTAKCVLMYALGRSVCPVDVHCARVGNRIGWFDPAPKKWRKKHMGLVEAAVPKSLHKPLHIRLIQHGREVCSPITPKCERCPINAHCDFYQSLEPQGTLDS